MSFTISLLKELLVKTIESLIRSPMLGVLYLFYWVAFFGFVLEVIKNPAVISMIFMVVALLASGWEDRKI